MTVDVPTLAIAGPLLLVLFGYAFRLIRRSDAERDRYVRRIERERDMWMAKALGDPLPPPLELDQIPDPEGPK